MSGTLNANYVQSDVGANLYFNTAVSSGPVIATVPVYTGAGAATPLGGATNPVSGGIQSANNYIQKYVYNTANGTYTSADFTAYPANGTDAAGWVDMGITSLAFNQYSYSVTGPNEGYILMSAPSGSNTSGNLVYATDATGNYNSHQWYVNGFTNAKANVAMTLDKNSNLKVAGTVSATNTFGFKNRLINGAMMIDQRANGANTSLNGSTGSQIGIDRFQCNNYGTGLTANSMYYQLMTSSNTAAPNYEVNSAPPGFSNSLKITCTNGQATSGLSAIRRNIEATLEGYVIADLGWGTANAKTCTLSFWAKSNQTGTFAIGIENYYGTTSYVTTYTISAANTWTYITLTIPGPTIGGQGTTTGFPTDNNGSAQIFWDLGQGSSISQSNSANLNTWLSGDYRGFTSAVHIGDTSGANFYITGVQFEVGPQATPFDWRPYGMELALCQRYTYVYNNTGLSDQTYAYSPYSPASYTSLPNSSASMPIYFPVTMRSAATISNVTGGSASSLNRQTASASQVVFQWSSTSSGSAYYVGSFIASAEI